MLPRAVAALLGKCVPASLRDPHFLMLVWWGHELGGNLRLQRKDRPPGSIRVSRISPHCHVLPFSVQRLGELVDTEAVQAPQPSRPPHPTLGMLSHNPPHSSESNREVSKALKEGDSWPRSQSWCKAGGD